MPDCQNCSEPITEHGRNWIHTNGRFLCVGSRGYAVPLEPIEVLLDDAYAAGYRDGSCDGADDA